MATPFRPLAVRTRPLSQLSVYKSIPQDVLVTKQPVAAIRQFLLGEIGVGQVVRLVATVVAAPPALRRRH